MVSSSRPGWRIAALSVSLVASLATLPTSPAAADQNRSGSAPKVVASGLNNPRHIRWADGALYVAESGVGGTGPCITAGEGVNCYGTSGSITRIKKGGQARVVTGLPSIAGEGGVSATGPSDVSVRGRNFKVVIGLGADPAARAQLPRLGQKMATLSKGRFGRSGLSVVADLGRYEAKKNPDGKQIDTNPVALLSKGRRDVAVDAGGNSLLSIQRHRGIRTLATFPTVDVPAPPFLGLPPGTLIPMDAVPTAAAYGPDGALYVSQLTGFPFPVGGASIWRVAPGKAPTKYATGLTNVTDLAFGRDGSLYAVQIADAGLLGAPVGSVVRIPRGGGASHSTLVGQLNSPYGIALHDGSAYVTTCSTCAGGGEVLRVSLKRPAS